jgi:hypothetical protein
VDGLERLLAAEEIRQAVLRYCRGVDRLDVSLMRSAYLPGAVDDHGVYVGDAAVFCERVVGSHAGYDATMHCVLNHAVEVDAPGAARGEAYVVTYVLRTAADGVRWRDTWWGRYVDRYGVHEGRWGIAHRVCVHEFTESAPLGPPMDKPLDRFRQGREDRGTGALLGPAAFGA